MKHLQKLIPASLFSILLSPAFSQTIANDSSLISAIDYDSNNPISISETVFDNTETNSEFVGGVFAMTNRSTTNSIVAYGRRLDGTLSLIGEFRTGGRGDAFDGGEGLDPLISANALIMTENRRFLIAVNAGSDSISVLRINDDLSLRLVSRRRVFGVGPNSIAYRDGLVYVSSIDSDGQFAGEPDQEGGLTGFRLSASGRLLSIRNSRRELGNRPSAVQFSPDGRFLAVSSINAGSAALASGSTDELVIYQVMRNGMLGEEPVSAATSTLPFNNENRNLPSAIGFDIVEDEGNQYVVVTEAREFQADGSPPAFPALQTGSVSSWELSHEGDLLPVNLDVMTGTSQFDGERTACWIEFSKDGNTFWVSNALESSLSSFSFDEGQVSLINRTEANGVGPADGDPFGTTEGWIDLWISDDGEYLYQLFGLDGSIGVFKIGEQGEGSSLELIQTVSDLPDVNTQGIVAF